MKEVGQRSRVIQLLHVFQTIAKKLRFHSPAAYQCMIVSATTFVLRLQVLKSELGDPV